MKDSFRRAVRTLLQLIAAGGLSEVVNELLVELDGTARALVVVGAAFLVTWAQNELEDRGWVPSVLKARASDGASPVTNDPVL